MVRSPTDQDVIYNTITRLRGDLVSLRPARTAADSVAFRNRHLSTPLHVSLLPTFPLVETSPAEGNWQVSLHFQDAPDAQTRADAGYRD